MTYSCLRTARGLLLMLSHDNGDGESWWSFIHAHDRRASDTVPLCDQARPGLPGLVARVEPVVLNSAMAIFYEDVLRALVAAEVDFVVVGGVAVVLHGVPRMTADLDIVAALDTANIAKLAELMAELGLRPRVLADPLGLADPETRRQWIEEKGMRAFTFQHSTRPLETVDVLTDAPVSFDGLVASAHTVTVGELTFRIAGIGSLIALKRVAAREQDLSDIDALERLLQAMGDDE